MPAIARNGYIYGSAPSGTIDADNVAYDNTTSQLDSTNVQSAIDELKELVDEGGGGGVTYSLSVGEGDDANKIILTPSTGEPDKVVVPYATDAGTVDGFTVGVSVPSTAVFTDTTDAADLTYDNTTSGMAATTVQAAIDELDSSKADSSDIVTYTISQDSTDGHIIGLVPSTGQGSTVTIPDNNTTYSLSAGTDDDANKIILTPSSGTADKITVPYATEANNAQTVKGNTVPVDFEGTAYQWSQLTTEQKKSYDRAIITDDYDEFEYKEADLISYNNTVSGLASTTVQSAIDELNSDIQSLPEPMVFRGSLGQGGTITSLPVNGSADVGDTYKVITAGTYASQVAKVGDTFICLTKTSSANTWELIPSGDEPSGTVTSVGVSNGGGLSISGSPITSSGTITITNTGVLSVAEGSTNGTVSVNTGGTTEDVSVKGLGSAAFKDVTDSYSSSGTDPVSGTAVASAISNLSDTIQFIGTSDQWNQLSTADKKSYDIAFITND